MPHPLRYYECCLSYRSFGAAPLVGSCAVRVRSPISHLDHGLSTNRRTPGASAFDCDAYFGDTDAPTTQVSAVQAPNGQPARSGTLVPVRTATLPPMNHIPQHSVTAIPHEAGFQEGWGADENDADRLSQDSSVTSLNTITRRRIRALHQTGWRLSIPKPSTHPQPFGCCPAWCHTLHRAPCGAHHEPPLIFAWGNSLPLMQGS